jgi:hypothetical protein
VRLTPALILLAGYVLIAALMLQLPKDETPPVEAGKPSPTRIVAPRISDSGPCTNRSASPEAPKGHSGVKFGGSGVDEALRRIDLFFGAAQTVADASEPVPAARPSKLAEAVGLSLEGNEQTLEQLLAYSGINCFRRRSRKTWLYCLATALCPRRRTSR